MPVIVNLNEIDVERVLFIGVGNRQRGDDGVGSILIDILSSKGFPNVIDAGSVPENYTKTIVEYSPKTILIFDALSFGGKPGEWQILTIEELDESGVSTHNTSLHLFASYISQRISTNILLFGIQPETTEVCEGLSPAVEESANKIVVLINRHFRTK